MSTCSPFDFYQYHLKMAPVRIELELTEACNLRCLFCYNTLKPTFAKTSDVLKVLDGLAEQGVLEIILTGGEPLLHGDFRIIAAHAGKLFANTLLQTNGTLLDQQLVKFLKDSGFMGLNISLHGDVNVHDLLTGSIGSYTKAINAIDLALNSTLMIWVNMVLTKQNRESLVDHLLALRQRGVRNFTFTRFTPTGSGRDAKLAMRRHELVEVIDRLNKFQHDNRDCTVLVANSIPRCALPHELREYSEPCSYGINRFYVNTLGELMLCGMSRVVIGSLLNQTIEEIKQSSRDFERLCLNSSLPAECQSCKDVLLCRGGCRAAALATTKTIEGRDPLASHPL